MPLIPILIQIVHPVGNITRHGVHGGARGLYGSFSGKTPAAAAAAFAIVLVSGAFPLPANVMQFRHDKVTDTNLTEFVVSPTSMGWLDNIVKFRHEKIEE